MENFPTGNTHTHIAQKMILRNAFKPILSFIEIATLTEKWKGDAMLEIPTVGAIFV